MDINSDTHQNEFAFKAIETIILVTSKHQTLNIKHQTNLSMALNHLSGISFMLAVR